MQSRHPYCAWISCVSAAILTACGKDSGLPVAPGEEPLAPSLASASVAPNFVQVSGGGSHSCAITSTGRAYCWGFNNAGQLGDGTTTDRLTPMPVAGGLQFRQISAGFVHTCGVTTDDRAFCWGDGAFGDIGDGISGAKRPQPVAVEGGLRFLMVAAGLGHSCGLTVSGKAYCWGENDAGQLGNGTKTDHATPAAVAGARSWRQVTTGGFFTCGVTIAGTAFCWGKDQFGQLGDGPEKLNRSKPSAVAGGHVFTQIAAGFSSACAVDTDQHAWCWGFGHDGEIGDGNTLNRFTPRAVTGGLTVRRVTAGATACAETTTSRSFCWGANGFGQVGNGTTGGPVTRPLEVVGGFRFAEVSAGGSHVCARTSDGPTRCWGYNFFGQLGDATTTDRATPTLVAGPT